jgi:asparagine synthase (glutamine-hydrolysing)
VTAAATIRRGSRTDLFDMSNSMLGVYTPCGRLGNLSIPGPGVNCLKEFPDLRVSLDSRRGYSEQEEIGPDSRHYLLMLRPDHVFDEAEALPQVCAALKTCGSPRFPALQESSSLLSLSKCRWQGLVVLYEQSIHERGRSRLTFISDRLATCRLYYSYNTRGFFFATDLAEPFKLMRQLIGPLALDTASLGGYLRFLHQPGPKTLLRGFSILPPASCLTVSQAGLEITRYWSPRFTPTIESTREAVNTTRSLLVKSIEHHLKSPGEKCGLLLSGGVDSSMIAAVAEGRGHQLTTYTVGFDGIEDEREKARAVARHFRTRHREILIRPGDVENLMWEATRTLGFPTGNPSSVATYLVTRRAAEDVSKVLSGLGSDELLGGHGKHILARYWPMARPIWNLAGKLAAQAGGAPRFRPGTVSRYADLYTHFDDKQLQGLLLYPADGSSCSHVRPDDFSEEQFLVDLYCWLVDGILPSVATLTSRADLALALPFCADEIVELGARLPLSCKVRGLDAKWLLRRVASAVLPAWVLNGKRRGFTLPIARWFRGPLRHLLHTYLDNKVIERRGLFRPEAVRDLVRAHLRGAADFSLPLWALLTLEIWQQIFLDQ